MFECFFKGNGTVDLLLKKHLLIVLHINTYFLLIALLIAMDKLVYTLQIHWATWQERNMICFGSGDTMLALRGKLGLFFKSIFCGMFYLSFDFVCGLSGVHKCTGSFIYEEEFRFMHVIAVLMYSRGLQ